MLVLTLRNQERIVIGDREITVTLLAAQAGRVRLGIDAPKEMPVNREAIYLAKQPTNVAAGPGGSKYAAALDPVGGGSGPGTRLPRRSVRRSPIPTAGTQ